MISADDFDAYNKAVADMSDGLAKRVEESILAWMAEHPEASVAECREFAKEAMGGMAQVADDAAAALAAEWYDAQARATGVQLESAVTASVYSPELVDDVARYQAKKLLKGDRQGFAKCCAELVRNDALKSLNETIIANVGRDGGVGMRFARVTTGKEDCDFCLMLESRGAVYWTRKTAGEMRRFHRGCDCKVVPGIAGEPLMTLVEGHDPVDAYSKYLDMIGVPPEEKPARIQAHIDEMVERSWKEPRPQRERRRKWKSKRFGSIDEMRDYALAAESMEDLRERSRVLEEEFKESGLTGRYYDLLKGTVQARKRALLEQDRTEDSALEYAVGKSGVSISEWRCDAALVKHAKKHASDFGIDYRSADGQRAYSERCALIVKECDSYALVHDMAGQGSDECMICYKGEYVAAVNLTKRIFITGFRERKGASGYYDRIRDEIRKRHQG